MNSKGKNTTIAAYVGMVMAIAVLGMFLAGKIDLNQMLGAFGGIGTIIGVMVGLLSKDQNKSHTASTVDPSKPGGPKT